MISFTFDALIYFGEHAYSFCVWLHLLMYLDYVCELLWKEKFQFHCLGSKNILAIIIFPCKKKYQQSILKYASHWIHCTLLGFFSRLMFFNKREHINQSINTKSLTAIFSLFYQHLLIVQNSGLCYATLCMYIIYCHDRILQCISVQESY